MTRPWPRWLSISTGWIGFVVLVVGWILTTGADGDIPHVVSEGGAVAAMLAGALLIAKVLAPVLLRLLPEAGSGKGGSGKGGSGDKEDGRWQGEVSAMIRAQTDAFREVAAEMRGHSEALRLLIRENQDYHRDSRDFMREIRRGQGP